MEVPKRKYLKHKKSVKITIKHQLNITPNHEFDAISNEPLYPVYVTISVNKQFTRFRSRFRDILSPSNFEQKLNSPVIKEFIENERLIIEESIKKFNPEEKAYFKLTDWSKHYEIGLVEITNWVESTLEQIVAPHIYKKFVSNLNSAMSLPLDLKSVLIVMSMLNLREATTMLADYGLLLDLNIYESALRIKYAHNNVYCIWDYKSGYYQKELTLLLGNQAESVINQLDRFSRDIAHTF